MNFRKHLIAAAVSTAITVVQGAAITVSTAKPAFANSAGSSARSTLLERSGDPAIGRGKYLAAIAGCHDCHTSGYAQTGGAAPEARWLTGSSVGFKGPWGVSYPSNLRLTVQRITEDQWVSLARAQRLPPMPWFALRDMTDEDVRALYRFIRALGPAGERAPQPLAPGEPIRTPYMNFAPDALPVAANQ